MLLCYVRHGQTDWNVLGKLQGTEDVPLNDTGREQALLCANYLKKEKWDRILSSPLQRAVETAHILSQNTNHAPVMIENDFIERDFGIASGLTNQELKERYPHFPEELPDQMEPFDELCNRISKASTTIAKQYLGEKIIIVSHGGAINALLYHLSAGKIGTGITFLKNTGICLLNYIEDTDSLSIFQHNLTPEEFFDL